MEHKKVRWGFSFELYMGPSCSDYFNEWFAPTCPPPFSQDWSESFEWSFIRPIASGIEGAGGGGGSVGGGKGARNEEETRALEIAAQKAVHRRTILITAAQEAAEATAASAEAIIKMVDTIERNPGDASKRKLKATPGGVMEALLLAMGFKSNGVSSDNRKCFIAECFEDVQHSLTVVRSALDRSRPNFQVAAASLSSS